MTWKRSVIFMEKICDKIVKLATALTLQEREKK